MNYEMPRLTMILKTAVFGQRAMRTISLFPSHYLPHFCLLLGYPTEPAKFKPQWQILWIL
jgi:hypothetical protein